MEGKFTDKLKIVLAEPQATHRQYLLEQFKRTFPEAEVVESRSESETEAFLRTLTFDLCVLGSGFSEEVQHELAGYGREATVSSPCGVIPVVHRTSNEALLAYIRSGAHALLLPPISSESLAEVVDSALKSAKKKPAGVSDAHEEINSLPWILESFADRLEAVAARLKSAEERGLFVEATPKIITEALLSAVAASSDKEDLGVERVAELLLKKAVKQPS